MRERKQLEEKQNDLSTEYVKVMYNFMKEREYSFIFASKLKSMSKKVLDNLMEDKYTELIGEGTSENEAVGTVISEFGDLNELAESLGIEGFLGHNSAAADPGFKGDRKAVTDSEFMENNSAAADMSENSRSAQPPHATAELAGTNGQRSSADSSETVSHHSKRRFRRAACGGIACKAKFNGRSAEQVLHGIGLVMGIMVVWCFKAIVDKDLRIVCRHGAHQRSDRIAGQVVSVGSDL